MRHRNPFGRGIRGGGSLALIVWIALLASMAGCDYAGDPDDDGGPVPSDSLGFLDVSAIALPDEVRRPAFTMDASPLDVDDDGDVDLILAIEFDRNLLLLNDGTGIFTTAQSGFPDVKRDTEDIAWADFDGDGDFDVVFVSETDRVNEYYFNDGTGQFGQTLVEIPVDGITNAVDVADFDGDGWDDLILGNIGQNTLLLNDGTGTGAFVEDTGFRLPVLNDATQDLVLGDLDGDGDLDLVVGNEGNNYLLLNDGTGTFLEAPGRIPLRNTPEETRQVALGDVDGDGDLDIYFANVDLLVPGADPRNRLLLNDGNATFTEAAAGALPPSTARSFDARFVDIDADDDLDLIVTDAELNGQVDRPFLVHRNDGTGRFTDATEDLFPETAVGAGFDIEAADFNGDGLIDLFLASRGRPDLLLLRQ